MTPISDQQFETILLRLESGESLPAIQADFPNLAEDIAALQDLQDFFAAQRLQVQPDPEGLRGVLRQIEALESSEPEDGFSWGSFFAAWQRYAMVLPALLVMAAGGYWWQQQIPSDAVVMTPTSKRLVAQTDTPNTEVMDMAALAESLSAEFASDMAEFETTKQELEPLYTEQLFSYNAPMQL